MSSLFGIDVSAHQPRDITSKVKYDFAVVKVSGNPKQNNYKYDYINPSAKDQLNYAYKKTGLVGCYHFTYGLDNPETEADFFVSQVKSLGYLNKAVLVIDYEGPALKNGRNWVKKLCDRVKEKAKYTPVLYSYGSAILAQKLGELGYPIWCANYYKGHEEIHGYNTKGMKIAYDQAKIWQFTSSCILEGYAEHLDANEFFGTKEAWKRLANIKTTTKVENINQWYQVISEDGMNIRQSYSVSSKKLKTIPKGTKFKATKKHNNWVYSEDYNGWVCKQSKSKTYLKEIDAPKASKPVSSTKKDTELTKVAKDVIAGKYGNGWVRTLRLKMKGYNPKKVQAEVNKLLKK